MSGTRKRRGFGFLELCLSILLVALLTSALVVHHRQDMDESRLRIVHHDLDFLRRQLAIHRLEHPGPLPDLSQLESLQPSALIDPWGNPYVLLPEEPAQLVCVGPDGVLGESASDADDDVRVALGRALREWQAPQPAGSIEGESQSVAGVEVQWIHPLRWGAGVPQLPSLIPYPETMRAGISIHAENPRCLADAGGPAIYFAIMLKRGRDWLPELEVDRLALLKRMAVMDVSLTLTGPDGVERLTVTPTALPCSVSRALQTQVDEPEKPYRMLYYPEDWFMQFKVKAPRGPDGKFLVPITAVGIGADVQHGEDQTGADPLFWERIMLMFRRASLPEDLCPGKYRLDAMVISGSTELARSRLDFEIGASPAITLVSRNIERDARVPAPPTTLRLELATEILADEAVRAALRGGSLELNAWCDETFLTSAGPPHVIEGHRFEATFLMPGALSLGEHRIRLHLAYRGPEHPRGLQVCERWKFFIEGSGAGR